MRIFNKKLINITYNKLVLIMVYSHEVENMCCVAKGPNHGPAPHSRRRQMVQAKEIKDISGLTHGIGWCAPQQVPAS